MDLLTWRYALRHPLCPLSGVARGVAAALSTWANSDGGSMHPSVELVSVAAGLHRETTRRCLQEIVLHNFVLRTRVDRHDGGYYYVYRAAVPRGWQLRTLRALREWEKDPQYSSERKKRPRAQQGRVPVVGGDAVPAQDCAASLSTTVQRPCPGLCSVPVQGSTTEGSTEGRTETHNNRGKQINESIRDAASPKSPARESRSNKNSDFERVLDVVEKVSRTLNLQSPPSAADAAHIANVAGLTPKQVREAFKQLSDRRRLPVAQHVQEQHP